MASERIDRREFVSAAAAAGLNVAGRRGSPEQGRGKVAPGAEVPAEVRRTRSYNPEMEYRQLGRTGLWISAVSMGGHWKRIPYRHGSPEFKRNRREVIYAAMDHGINYIDACCAPEVAVYAEALGKRREEIYFGFDWTLARDPRVAGSLQRLKQGLEEGMRRSGLEYVDLWRITLREHTPANTEREIENVMAAFDWAKRTGKARFTGVSTHHRPWIAEAVAKYPEIEVVITPYAAGSKERPHGSMFEAIRRHKVGLIGIKPFASGTLFLSRGQPDSKTKEEDDRRARLALRYVLCCDVLTAAIPGLITVDQVRNAAAAIKERREFDLAERQYFQRLSGEMWANLPEHYQWLRQWRYV